MIRIALGALVILSACRTTTPDAGYLKNNSGDTACQQLTTNLQWVAPSGGFTGADVYLAVNTRSIGPHASVGLSYCIRCDGKYPGASEPWIQTPATATGRMLGPNKDYSEFKAHFDLGSNVGNPRIWANVIGFVKNDNGMVFDNNFMGGSMRSIRIEGYSSLFPASLKSQYDNKCHSILDTAT